ncbi:hypothetical protein [Actinopolymorpha pittospori]|uniref:DUF4386 family protein n=1 Tax=Actinopolymorpha pittospori TaxID=648752 RepID=A0A927R6X5_9ACTN|nr:hypothetical protein [Actinopolymorpha pittospori]MBE1603604.1 hypothetical protein [Actinopolymorpha pittospori]
MTITPSTLTRSAGIAAVAAGATFIAVQLNHPPLTVAGVHPAEWAIRSSLKMLMGALALVGINGMYLYQVRKMGVLGLIGFVLFAANYLVIVSTSFVAAIVLPAIADTSPTYVTNVLVAASGHHPAGDTGSLYTVLLLGGFLYVTGGLLFGIALYRARVLPRWAAALLAVGGLAAAGLALLPDPWFRLLAVPNGIAMIALGYSLWRIVGAERTGTTDITHTTETTETTEVNETVTLPAAVALPRVATVGPE